jgi:TP901 family phage tail tape measure protein
VAEEFELAKAFVTVDMQVKQVQGQLDKVEKRVETSANRMERRFGAVGQRLRQMLGAFAGYRFLKGIIDETARWSEQIAKVSTMLDTRTMPILASYKDAIEDLGVQYGQSSKVLSKGLYDILSSAFAAEDAMQILDVATKGAKAGFTATSTSVDIMTTILNSYKLGAEDALYVSDLLFAAVKRGKTTYEELAQSLGNVTAVSNLAGLKLEELLALYSTLTRGGIKPPEAVTAIQGMLRAFLKPQKDAIQLAREWGLELDSNTLGSEGLLAVMEKLQYASAEELATIGGRIRGFKALAVAINDLEGLGTDIELQFAATGSTVEAADKAMGTFKHSIDQLSVAWNTFKHTFGEELAVPVLAPLIDLLTKTLALAGDASEAVGTGVGIANRYGTEGPKKTPFALGFLDIMASILGSIEGDAEGIDMKTYWRERFNLNEAEDRFISEQGADAREKRENEKRIEELEEKPKGKAFGEFLYNAMTGKGPIIPDSEVKARLMRTVRGYTQAKPEDREKFFTDMQGRATSITTALTPEDTGGLSSQSRKLRLQLKDDKRGAGLETRRQNEIEDKKTAEKDIYQRKQEVSELDRLTWGFVQKRLDRELVETKKQITEKYKLDKQLFNKKIDEEEKKKAEQEEKKAERARKKLEREEKRLTKLPNRKPFNVLDRIWGEGSGMERVSMPSAKLRDQTVVKLSELIIISEAIEKNTGKEQRIGR